MNKAAAFILLLAITLTMAACSDDGPVIPEPFMVAIEVVDGEGNPVSGLDMSLASALPFYQDQLKSPAKASVVIPFIVAETCIVNLFVEDITGSKVKAMVNGVLMPGSHSVVWNGQDNEGNPLASGVYTACFVVVNQESGNLLYEERTPMYMAILDPARVSVGTTNADGLIKLTDKKLFPNLYNAPEFAALDENGQQLGLIQFTDSMRFQLADLTNGGSKVFYEDVTGSKTINVVWSGTTKPRDNPESSILGDRPEAGLNEVSFDLGSPYPMPFN